MKSRPYPPKSLDAIAERLELFREALGLNAARLCRLTGIKANTYSQWKSAKSRPGLDEAIQFCEKTGTTLDWLYLGSVGGFPGELSEKMAAVAERLAKRPALRAVPSPRRKTT